MLLSRATLTDYNNANETKDDNQRQIREGLQFQNDARLMDGNVVKNLIYLSYMTIKEEANFTFILESQGAISMLFAITLSHIVPS